MKIQLRQIAAGLAFVIGAMAVVAGGKVLLGNLPDYHVIGWVPVYNFSVGLISVAFTAVAIWRKGRLAFPAAIATLGAHTIVMLILQTAYRSEVAPDSIQAMTIRIITWVAILGLMFVQSRLDAGCSIVHRAPTPPEA